MIVFIVVTIIFLILDMVFKNKNILTVIYSIILIILSGLRSYSVGTDTYGYYNLFRNIDSIEYASLFDNITNMKDPFFYILSKFLKTLFISERMLFIIYAVVFMTLVSIIIKKYSNNKFLTYVMFICLPYFFFSMTALRQGIALAFCFFSIQYMIKKEYLKFVLCIIIGALFHKTALVFLVAPFVCNIKIKFVNFIFIPISYLVSIIFKTEIYNLAIFLLSDRAEYYLTYNMSLNNTLLFINTVMLLVSYFLYKTNKKEDVFFEKTFNLYLFGILFLPFSGIIAEFFRISMCFMIVIIILLPNVIKNIENVITRKIITIVVYIILILYMVISNGNNYGIFPYSILGV